MANYGINHYICLKDMSYGQYVILFVSIESDAVPYMGGVNGDGMEIWKKIIFCQVHAVACSDNIFDSTASHHMSGHRSYRIPVDHGDMGVCSSSALFPDGTGVRHSPWMEKTS